MNGAHIHLIVTHLPVLGIVFATALLGFGLWRNSRPVQQTALTVFVLVGLAAGAAFLTGEGAEEAVEETLAGGDAIIERHEEAAQVGLAVAGFGGALALLTMAIGRRGRALPRGMVVASLLVGLVGTGVLTWVANLGGQIGHPEIRSAQAGGVVEAGEDADDDDGGNDH